MTEQRELNAADLVGALNQPPKGADTLAPTLDWITDEIAELGQLAAAIEERLSVLREVRARLNGTPTAPERQQRKRGKRGDQAAPGAQSEELGI